MINFGNKKPRQKKCRACGFWTRHRDCPQCGKPVNPESPFNMVRDLIDPETITRLLMIGGSARKRYHHEV
jgi:hypothetical protein